MTGCRCGHPAPVHDHYRNGTDCAACGCPAYRGPHILELIADAAAALVWTVIAAIEKRANR